MRRMTVSSSWSVKSPRQVLQAACSLQYDSAVLPGAQLCVPLRREPISARQQKSSRLDGLEEEADDARPRRGFVPVTEKELIGHLKMEEESRTVLTDSEVVTDTTADDVTRLEGDGAVPVSPQAIERMTTEERSKWIDAMQF